MASALPFPVPTRLPRRITPCPIVEAVMEIRFVPKRPWEHFPGLFADKFGKAFPVEEDVGIAQIPQPLRDQDPRLTHLPYRRFVGEKFTLQAGPRVVGLVTQRNQYPGWDTFWPAMSGVMRGVHELGVIKEPVRFGLRYINFFSFEIFEKLALSLNIGGTTLKNPETGLNTVFLQDGFRHFVQINNSSIIGGPNNTTIFGSIVDIDTTSTKPILNILTDAESFFNAAHIAEKNVFFGLLKPEYLATLKTEY